MGTIEDKVSGDPADPIAGLRGGERHARATRFDPYRDRLRRMVEWRRDPRLRARLDAADIVYEAFLDIVRKHTERSCVIDTFFALARHPWGRPPGKVPLGVTC
jgi:hypothetical protein